MSRIEATFKRLKDKKALIPFVTAGYPSLDITSKLMHEMVKAGADVIELGVPFSDPSADGVVIQKAGELALSNGIDLSKIFAMVRNFREQDEQTPVVLMGYANPIEAYAFKHGGAAFAKDAHAAGVDGILIVDYPPSECLQFASSLREYGLDLIFLLSPTSTTQRIQEIAQVASGYVYYVSLKGVTGSAGIDVESVKEKLTVIRSYVSLPIGVGFGIRDTLSAKRVGACADAVIIGSRIIELLTEQSDEDACRRVAQFLREVRAALDE